MTLEYFNIRKIGLRNLDNDLNLINGNNNIYFLFTLHRQYNTIELSEVAIMV